MLTAAAVWQDLSVDLYSAAYSLRSVISRLTAGPWLGSSASAMAAAALPYAAWLSATAATATATANQARAAAAAYEAAFAKTVPPALIAENRARLTALTATNIFGQNTPAIAVTEADYMQMWAQDATAMYSYAGESGVATAHLPVFESAPEIVSRGRPRRRPSAVEEIADLGALSSPTVEIAPAPGQLAVPGPIALAQTAPDTVDAVVTHLPPISELVSMASLRISDGAMVLSGVLPAVLGAGGQGASESAAAGADVGEELFEDAAAVAGIPGSPIAGGLMPIAQMGGAGSVRHLAVPPSWAQAGQGSLALPALPGFGSSNVAADDIPGQLFGATPLFNLANTADRNAVSSVLQVNPRAYAVPRIPAAG